MCTRVQRRVQLRGTETLACAVVGVQLRGTEMLPCAWRVQWLETCLPRFPVQLSFLNRFDFTTGSELEWTWVLELEGRVVLLPA